MSAKITKIEVKVTKVRGVFDIIGHGTEYADGLGMMEVHGTIHELHKLEGGFVLCGAISRRPTRIFRTGPEVDKWLRKEYPHAEIKVE